MNVLLFSAMGVGGRSPLAEGCVQQLSVGSDTGRRLSVSNHVPRQPWDLV